MDLGCLVVPSVYTMSNSDRDGLLFVLLQWPVKYRQFNWMVRRGILLHTLLKGYSRATGDFIVGLRCVAMDLYYIKFVSDMWGWVHKHTMNSERMPSHLRKTFEARATTPVFTATKTEKIRTHWIRQLDVVGFFRLYSKDRQWRSNRSHRTLLNLGVANLYFSAYKIRLHSQHLNTQKNMYALKRLQRRTGIHDYRWFNSLYT